MMTLKSAVLSLAALALAAPAYAAFNVDAPMPVEISILQGNNGKYEFQSDFGHEFYTYDKDGKNKSNCDDTCAEVWAPVKARDGAKNMGDWTLVDRGKGYMQWSYKGKPIYMSVPQVVSNEDPKLHNDGHWHLLVPE